MAVKQQLRRAQLYPYQRKAVKLGKTNEHFALFLDMGLGKTVSVLTILADLFDRGEIKNVLILAPKRVIESVWRQEAGKWKHISHLTFSLVAGDPKKRIAALEAEAQIYLCSVDNTPWLCGVFGGGYLPFDMLVIDESSCFKNPQSIRFKALKPIAPKIKRLLLLSGTPISSGLLDLWSQMFLLDSGERLGYSFGQYKNMYFKPAAKSGDRVLSYALKQRGYADIIHDKISDICVSMLKEDYLQLPPLIDNTVFVDLGDKLRGAYEDFTRDLVLELFGEGQPITVANATVLGNKLLQFANGAVYDADRNVRVVHDLKLDALDEIIEGAGGVPVLTSVCFQFDHARILERFKSIKPRRMQTQQDIDDWNDGKIRLMTMHPKSGGHGLNLQYGGNQMVMFGQTWGLELNQQFVNRVHRNGNTYDRVMLHRIMARGTHDEKVIKSLGVKDGTQRALLDAVSELKRKYIKSF